MGVADVGECEMRLEARTLKRSKRHAPMAGLFSLVPLCILPFVVLMGSAWAHNPDTSYCKVTITPREVVCRFTYDLLTLQRITALDANGDGNVSRAEMEAAFPAIVRFLRERVYLDLNQREAEFAEAEPIVWPQDATDGIPKSEFGQRLLKVTFRNPLLGAPEDVTLTFDFFGAVSNRLSKAYVHCAW